MTSRIDRTAGSIDWPNWAERTPTRERERTSKYSVTQDAAIKRLRKEILDRLDADDWRLSTAAPHRKRDGLPYADSNPDDPAVVVRWSKDGKQYCVACDRYTDLRDNVRTLGLYIEEKRKMSNRPVHTGQDEFATARLPSGNEDAIVADQPPHTLLEVPPDADAETIKQAFREKAKETHADVGGDSETFKSVKEAKERMLQEVKQ